MAPLNCGLFPTVYTPAYDPWYVNLHNSFPITDEPSLLDPHSGHSLSVMSRHVVGIIRCVVKAQAITLQLLSSDDMGDLWGSTERVCDHHCIKQACLWRPNGVSLVSSYKFNPTPLCAFVCVSLTWICIIYVDHIVMYN